MKKRIIIPIFLMLVICGCSEETINYSSNPSLNSMNLNGFSSSSEETLETKPKEKSEVIIEKQETPKVVKPTDPTIEPSDKPNDQNVDSETIQKKEEKEAISQPPKKSVPPSKIATEKDKGAIAGKLIEYLNEYRVAQGSPPAAILSEYIPYAEYQSRQLVSHFAHDTLDEREAATALHIGTYVNPADYGMDGDPYYTADVREAIGYSGVAGTVEEVARNLADMVRGSPSHWNYVGGADYTRISVGITYDSNRWYVDIAMKN